MYSAGMRTFFKYGFPSSYIVSDIYKRARKRGKEMESL